MPLFKATKRDIVKAAAGKARQQLHNESKELARQAVELKSQAKAAMLEKANVRGGEQENALQPLVNGLNDLTAAAGYGRPFGVGSRRQEVRGEHSGTGYSVTSCIALSYEKIRIVSTIENPGAKDLEEEIRDLNTRANVLRSTATQLTDQDVISGKINEALNGETAAAMQIVVDNIAKVALEQHEAKR